MSKQNTFWAIQCDGLINQCTIGCEKKEAIEEICDTELTLRSLFHPNEYGKTTKEEMWNILQEEGHECVQVEVIVLKEEPVICEECGIEIPMNGIVSHKGGCSHIPS